MRKVIVVLALAAALGGGIAYTLRPLTDAQSKRMAMETTLFAEQQAALNALALQERTETSGARVRSVQMMMWAGVVGALLALGVLASIGARIAAEQIRRMRLPVARQVADGVHIVEAGGRFWLLDMYTGQQALLGDAHGVEMMRAEIMQRQVAIDRLARAAERIALTTRNGRTAADALPYIGVIQ